MGAPAARCVHGWCLVSFWYGGDDVQQVFEELSARFFKKKASKFQEKK